MNSRTARSDKTFALRIIRLSAAMPRNRMVTFSAVNPQSGTSVGANYREAPPSVVTKAFRDDAGDRHPGRRGDQPIGWSSSPNQTRSNLRSFRPDAPVRRACRDPHGNCPHCEASNQKS